MRQMISIPIDVRRHLEAQGDMSKYIVKLIRDDMNNSLESKIRRIVEDILKGTNIQPSSNSTDSTVKDCIKNIMGL